MKSEATGGADHFGVGAAQLFEAGWFLCYSDDATRKTWHYFDEGSSRSRCGSGASYQRSIGEVQRVPSMSGFALQVAGFCQRCDRTRRAEEGR